MKGTFLRKIAAVGTGLALVAGSVVAAVNWSDLVDTNEKTMKINGIVVGAQAQPSDSTAAASLAAKLAEKFVYEKDTEVKEQVPVEGTAGLDATKGYLRKDATLGAIYNKQVGSGQLKALINESKSMIVNKNSVSKTIKEYIEIETTPKYATAKNIQELVSEVPAKKFKYTVNSGDLDLATPNYEANGDNYVTLPFLGEWYELDLADKASGKLELIAEDNAETWYDEGESITGLASKDGKTTYKVTVQNAYTDGAGKNRATLQLFDETTGNLVSTEEVKDGDTVRFRSKGKELLRESIKVKGISKRNVSSSDVFRVNIRTGLNRVVLQDNKCYPNWEDAASKTKCDWRAVVNFDNNKLSSYGIESINSYTGSSALKVDDSLVLPNNYGAVQFLGLTEEDAYKVELGVPTQNASGEASEYGFSFIDNDDTTRVIPYTFDLGSVPFENDDIEGFEVMIDNQEYTLVLERDGNNLKYKLESGFDVDPENVTTALLTTDFFKNIDGDMNITKAITFDEGDVDVDYNVMLSNYDLSPNDYQVWLLLAPQTFSLAEGKELSFLGTDTSEDGTKDEGTFFLNNESFIIGDVKDDEFYTAVFKLDDVYTYIDTTTGVLTDDDAEDNSLNYAMKYGTNNLRTKDKERKQYVDEDFTLTIVDDKVGSIEYYDKARFAKYLFFDKTGVTGETSYEEKVVTKKVKTVFGNVPTSSILDNEAGSGKYIVVGGYAVNSLFQKVAKDADEAAEFFGTSLAQEGDKVTKLHAGNLYVAGYTAQDTIDAVDALIKELDSFEW